MKGSYKRSGRIGRKGQSLIEYVVLVATVTGFLIIFLRPGGQFSRELTNVAEQQGQDMLNMAAKIFR